MQIPQTHRSNFPARKIWLILVLLTLASNVYATPLYYTFEGEVSNIFNSENDFDATKYNGLDIGNSLSYTFLIDFDAAGTRTRSDGSVFEFQDNTRYDAFYTDYIAGDKLSLTSVDGIKEFNFGKSRQNRVGNIVGGNALVLYSFDISIVQEWAIGTNVNSIDLGYGDDSSFTLLSGDLTLTNISDTYNMDIPEPATLLLFSLGLLGLRYNYSRRNVNIKPPEIQG